MVSTSDGFPAIFKVADEIPQGIDDLPQHSLEWRYLLQQIRNAKANANPGVYEMARLYQAYCAILPGDGRKPDSEDSKKLSKISGKKMFVGITIYVSAAIAGLREKGKVGELVPYKSGEFLDEDGNRIPAEGTMVRVTLPTIFDAKGVICLGEWEPA